MRAEKQNISNEYLARLQSSPYFVVVDYRGLKVGHFSELRKRLKTVKAEVHVIKTSLFRIAAHEAGVADLDPGALAGQLAVVHGGQDVSSAAKILKNFHAEFEKPVFKLGYLDSRRLSREDLQALADLPSLEVLRGTLMALLQTPAGALARLLNTPATQLARVLKARMEKGEASA
jgi:large subunit ribosomal protein L10